MADHADAALSCLLACGVHAVYLSGREAFLNLSADPHATMRPEWGRWCEAVHQGTWEYKFWTEESALALLDKVRRQGLLRRHQAGVVRAVVSSMHASSAAWPDWRQRRRRQACRHALLPNCTALSLYCSIMRGFCQRGTHFGRL